MSWLFGPSKSNLPPITPLQEQRTRQIESLKSLNPNVVELKRDVEYRVTFSLAPGTTNIALHITLPPQFPQEKPMVKVSPPLRHPWVNNLLTIVGCPSLNNFGVQTDLGRVIQGIVQEMRKNPPFLYTQDPVQVNAGTMYQPYPASSSLSPSGQYPMAPGHGYRPPPPGPPSTGILLQGNQVPSASLVATPSSHLPGAPAVAPAEVPAPNAIHTLEHLGIQPAILPTGNGGTGLVSRAYPMPAVPASLTEHLSGLSTAQLQELLGSEEEELRLFGRLPQVRRLLSDREELYQICEHLAQTNLSYQPELEKLKASLSERLQERNDLRNKFDMSCLNQQSITEQFDPRHTLDILRVAAADMEHESEAKAEVFLQGGLSADEFLREYTDLRKKMHLRKAKEEKLDYMLRHGGLLK